MTPMTMKHIATIKFALFISLLLAVPSAFAQSRPATTPATQPISNTTVALRTLWLPRWLVTGEGSPGKAVGGSPENAILAMFDGPAIGQDGYWMSGSDQPLVSVTLRDVPSKPDVYEVVVQLHMRPESPSTAKETMDARIQRLEETLAREQHVMQQRLDAAAREVEDCAEERDKLATASGSLKERLNAIGPLPSEPGTLDQMIAKLEEQRQTTGVELESLDARCKALNENLAMLSAKLQHRVEDDPVSAELRKVVEAKEANSRRVKELINNKLASTSDLDQASSALSEVKARLLERQELVASRAGGDILAAWNRELLNSGVDRAEKSARLDALSKRATALVAARDIAKSLADVENHLRAWQTKLEPLQQQYKAASDDAAQHSQAKIEIKAEKNW